MITQFQWQKIGVYFYIGVLFFSCANSSEEEVMEGFPISLRMQYEETLGDWNNVFSGGIAFNANSVVPVEDIVGEIVSGVLQGQYLDIDYDEVLYRGALGAMEVHPWYSNWSFYAGVLSGGDDAAMRRDKDRNKPSVSEVITDAMMRQMMQSGGNRVVLDGKASGVYYILDGFVFVEDGEVLEITPGTIITGRQENDNSVNEASALIISRGGMLLAEGTESDPIIFTYSADPLDGTTRPSESGKWGGLIILGRAKLNSAVNETAIEGLSTDEMRGLYGGDNDRDNSGILRYVSIRHGGSEIGAGNEINGLTLGGVGSLTSLSYVEVVGNRDDGVEFFGGTVNTKYVISLYCKDDAIDYDEGYRGFNQFIIVHQDPAQGAADRAMECDGGTQPETGRPYSMPLFVNITLIGNANARAITIRDNAGGHFFNGLVQGFNKGVDVEWISESDQDSWKQFTDGNLSFRSMTFSLDGKDDLGEVFTIATLTP